MRGKPGRDLGPSVFLREDGDQTSERIRSRGIEILLFEDQLLFPEFLHLQRKLNENEARYILSTAMMRRILDMRNRFGKDIRIGFKAFGLVPAVPHSHPFLEPDKGTPETNDRQLRGMLFELKYLPDTIEELDLNTRIRTKHQQSGNYNPQAPRSAFCAWRSREKRRSRCS